VALASTGLALGTAGIIGGAAFGLTWSTVLGVVVERVIHRDRWRRRLANASVFLAIIATGVMFGGGTMYGLVMKAAANAPEKVLSAMMQPTIPFFIVLNTPLELLVVPGAVFANWSNGARRRLILIAAASFYVLRLWSYLAYVPRRMEIASRPLSPDDLDWFQRSMDVDYRGAFLAIAFVVFTIATFVADPPAAPHAVDLERRASTCEPEPFSS
jgi:high-affinity Fe2+/Pb2+ permease